MIVCYMWIRLVKVKKCVKSANVIFCAQKSGAGRVKGWMDGWMDEW